MKYATIYKMLCHSQIPRYGTYFVNVIILIIYKCKLMMNIDENEMYASRTVNTSADSMSQYLIVQ